MKIRHLQLIHKNQSFEEVEAKIERYLPKRILLWIECNITRPIAGFESLRSIDGGYLSFHDQVLASREQLLLIALDYCDRGYPTEKIYRTLRYFV